MKKRRNKKNIQKTQKAQQAQLPVMTYVMPNQKFESILRATQEELFEGIFNAFHEKENLFYQRGAFLLVQGEAPILLIAHLDTVHIDKVSVICNTVSTLPDGTIEERLSSPQGIGGDDRCGVYAIITAYERAEVKPWLLFVCDEEIGCVGSGLFADEYLNPEGIIPPELDDIKFMIEIDRKGKDDSVYYECDNEEFEAYINSFGFKTQFGSYSDICEVAPAMHKAAVNLSSGYYNAHTTDEYIVEEQLNATIDKVSAIIADVMKEDVPAYEYIEAVHKYGSSYGSSYGNSYSGLGSFWDDWSWNSNWWQEEDETWFGYEYHTNQDYKDRCIKLNLGMCEINFYLEHDLTKQMWAEYVALLEIFTEKELDSIRDATGNEGIIELFHQNFGSWENYYYNYVASYDTAVGYC